MISYVQRKRRLALKTYWPGTPRDDTEVRLRDIIAAERKAREYGDAAAPDPHPGVKRK